MTVTIERSGPVFTVVLHRPDVDNAIDRATAEALTDAFETFESDSEACVAVLWGAGGTFCAGAALSPECRNRIVADGAGPMGPSRMRLSKPVIAAIAGHAVAGGLELALWADLRIAEEDSIFGVFCRRWGIPLIDGGTVRLPRLIGMGRALDLILTGRAVGAKEALAIGLVNRVVATNTARPAAEALARELCDLPQACLKSDRQSVYEQAGLDIQVAMRAEFSHGAATLAAAGTAPFERYAARDPRADL